jgi:iron complex outermembrane receptor protein
VENQEISDWGGHFLGRWQRIFSPTSSLALQVFYDGTDRKEAEVREIRHTWDLDFQHRFALGRIHELIWGLGYRYTHDRFRGTFELSLFPRERGVSLFSAFIQDEITLIRERLRLILGTRLEHNDYTGFEVQPNARVLWTPHPQHRLWASVSRAVRTPSRPEVNGVLNTSITPPAPLAPVPILGSASGNSNFKSEDLLAYELGYRWDFRRRFFLDVAAFYNVYDNLRALTQGPAQLSLSPIPHVVIPLLVSNAMKGETYGFEVAADWRPLTWWRLHLAFNFLQPKLRLKSSNALADPTIVGNDPKNQLSCRSTFDLPQHLELDLWLRYVSALRRLEVGSYATLDARLAWKPVKNLELAVVGQNLLQKRHLEFGQNELLFPTQVPRGVYGKVTWHY